MKRVRLGMIIPSSNTVVEQENCTMLARLDTMWSDCRTLYGGPFLFGAFCAADAMYAPMATRIHTYGIAMSREALGYVEVVMALPAFAEWRAAALREPWVLSADEVDWPQVRRVEQ